CGADARQSRHWPANETRARAAVGKQTLGSLVNGLRLLRRPAPTGRKRGTVGAANKGVVVEIPDCRLPSGGRVKQEVWLPIVIEISRRNQSPARGKSWPVNAAQERYTRQIPDRGLARVGIKEHEIGMTVTIEIREIDQIPARRKRLHISTSDKNVIIQIPHSCLPCTSAIQNIIGFAVAVDIGEKSARRQARDIVTEHSQRDSFWRANSDI